MFAVHFTFLGALYVSVIRSQLHGSLEDGSEIVFCEGLNSKYKLLFLCESNHKPFINEWT